VSWSYRPGPARTDSGRRWIRQSVDPVRRYAAGRIGLSRLAAYPSFRPPGRRSRGGSRGRRPIPRAVLVPLAAARSPSSAARCRRLWSCHCSGGVFGTDPRSMAAGLRCQPGRPGFGVGAQPGGDDHAVSDVGSPCAAGQRRPGYSVRMPTATDPRRCEFVSTSPAAGRNSLADWATFAMTHRPWSRWLADAFASRSPPGFLSYGQVHSQVSVLDEAVPGQGPALCQGSIGHFRISVR
jgi:hypothetical protein